MKVFLTILAIPVASLLATPVQTIDQLRGGTVPVSKRTPPPPVKVMVGEPTSSLSKDQALARAELLASSIPGAGVAMWPGEYNGKNSPILPVNAVYVVEPLAYDEMKPFDLIVIADPEKNLRARRVLAKGFDKVIVGFEDSPDTSEVAPQACVGRIVAHILFNPGAAPKAEPAR